MRKLSVALFMGLSLVVSTSHAALLDDFNDGSAAYTVQNGTVTESGGVVTGTNTALATYGGVTSSGLGVDAIASGGTSYIALVLNYSSLTDNLFVKIQDNNSNGLFDRIFFYHGNNGGSGVSGSSFYDLATEVSSSYFQVNDNGNGTVTAYIGATGEVVTKTLLNTYTGTGVGIGFYGAAQANNLYVDVAPVPEPETWLLMAIGMLALVRMRHRKA